MSPVKFTILSHDIQFVAPAKEGNKQLTLCQPEIRFAAMVSISSCAYTLVSYHQLKLSKSFCNA